MNVVTMLLQRLREPSTWAGISAIGLVVGIPEGAIDAVGQIIIGVTSLLSIVLPELGKTGGSDG